MQANTIYSDYNLNLVLIDDENFSKVMNLCLNGARNFINLLVGDEIGPNHEFLSEDFDHSLPFPHSERYNLAICSVSAFDNRQREPDDGLSELLGQRELIGFATIYFLENGESLIELLVIKEEFQSQGFGRKSVNLIENWLYYKKSVKRILVAVEKQNQPARLFFWPNLGYESSNREYSIERLGTVQEIAEMEKSF